MEESASATGAGLAAWKPNSQQVARAGEHFVAAELHRRGAYAVTFAGNMPRIDILASNRDQTRTIYIQVKTKRSGTWQTRTVAEEPMESVPADLRFWVFVDLRENPDNPPEYYVAPESWVLHNIYDFHRAYLALHGGARAGGGESTHHAIARTRILEWRDRWDLLGLF